MSDNKDDDFIEDIEFDDIEDFDDDLLDDDFATDDAELADDPSLESEESEEFEDDEDWGDADDADSHDTPVKSKSSSSKLLLPLLALIAAGGGGYFYYTQMMGNGSGGNITVPQEQQPDVMQDQVDNAVPPMDITPADIDTQNPSIPMPSPISNETGNIAEIDEQPVDMTAQDNLDISETAPALETPDNGILTPMPDLASNDSTTYQDISTDDIDAGNSAEEILTTDNSVDNVNNTDDAGNEFIPQDIQNDITPPPAEDMNSEQNNTAPSFVENNNNAEMEQIRSEMVALRDNLQNQISDLNSTIVQKDQAIQSLEDQVQGMENNLAQKDKELAALKKELQTAKTQASENSATQTQNTANTETKPATPVKKAPKQVETEIMPKWELRSAQPGRAYVSIKGSNDVQVVEEGDTLHGIGRILSISNQNGLWVVRGTNSNITQ